MTPPPRRKMTPETCKTSHRTQKWAQVTIDIVWALGRVYVSCFFQPTNYFISFRLYTYCGTAPCPTSLRRQKYRGPTTTRNSPAPPHNDDRRPSTHPDLARPPYNDGGHQHEHTTPYNGDGGPAFDGTDENGSARGTTGNGMMETTITRTTTETGRRPQQKRGGARGTQEMAGTE